MARVLVGHTLDQAARLRITQAQGDPFAAQRTQSIEQVADIEAYREIVDRGFDLDFLHGFFLLGIVGDDAHAPAR